jgi:signal transduction histidine kinase
MRFSFSTIRVQLTLVTLAALITVAVAILVISQVMGNTESLLVNEARRQTSLAASSLQQQLFERLHLEEESPLTLPARSRELSLRGITTTVLAGFPTVEGGYWFPGEERVSGNMQDLNEGEDLVLSICRRSAEARQSAQAKELLRGLDVWVIAAHPLISSDGRSQAVAWSVRRLHDLRNPGRMRLNQYLSLLAALSLVAVGSALAVTIRLRRQVRTATEGIRRFESDLTFRFGPQSGEFGEITEAINRMAGRRLELETELRRKEQLAVLGRLVASVAHEVRNPLNNLQLAIQLLLRQPAPATIQDRYRQLLGEVERMEGIVQQLLALVRRDSGQRNLQSLIPVLEHAVKALHLPARQRSISLECDFSSDAPAVSLNQTQMEQVFLNLLRNAIEASPPGSPVKISLFRQNGRAAVTITDQGPGVSKSDRNKLFQPFFSTKPQGVGLGLAISREIVEAHGGSIDFDASPDGTTVTVKLPLGAAS